MATTLSFVPRYHELKRLDGVLGWMPMYNPKRACVAEERQRIEAEGFSVESRPEKLEPLMRPAKITTEERLRRMRAQSKHDFQVALLFLMLVLGAFLLFAYLFGMLAMHWLVPDWYSSLHGWVAVAAVYGTGTVVAIPVLLLLGRQLFVVHTHE